MHLISKHVPSALLAVISTSVTAGAASLTEPYTITDLGTLGGIYSQAYGISEDGTVAGWATSASGIRHAVLWTDEGIMSLGVPPFGGGVAVAVNDDGQVAAYGEANPQSYRAYQWENGVWTETGMLPETNESIARDIDSAGRIVGQSFVLGPGDPDRAFLWDAGVLIDLGTLGGYSNAQGMNESGQVVGASLADLPDGTLQIRAFHWEDGVMVGLPPLSGDVATEAFDVNELGDVVGASWYYTTQFFSAKTGALWLSDTDSAIDLGVVPAAVGSCSANPYWHKSIARAVNNQRQIVGEAMCITSGAPRAAFLWEDGVMYNLNDLIPAGSGWDLHSARDINEAGEIVGYGASPVGELHAFLLTPPVTCPEDLVAPSGVEQQDLNAVLNRWGDADCLPGGQFYPCPEDLAAPDGVEQQDLNAVLNRWGDPTCEPVNARGDSGAPPRGMRSAGALAPR